MVRYYVEQPGSTRFALFDSEQVDFIATDLIPEAWKKMSLLPKRSWQSCVDDILKERGYCRDMIVTIDERRHEVKVVAAAPAASPPAGEVIPLKDLSYRLAEIDVDELEVDERYQRNISPFKLERMGKKPWDPMRAGALSCVASDSTIKIVDGQHRRALAKEKGIKRVLCLIWKSKGAPINEAQEFVDINSEHKMLTAADQLKALLAAGDKAAQEVMQVLTLFHLKPAGTPGYRGHKELSAVRAIMRIYQNIGREGLYDTLKIITEIWPKENQALSQTVILGVAKFLQAYQQEMADKEITVGAVITKLSKSDLGKLVRKAITSAELHGGAGPVNFARAMLHAFNNNKRTGGGGRRLPDLL